MQNQNKKFKKADNDIKRKILIATAWIMVIATVATATAVITANALNKRWTSLVIEGSLIEISGDMFSDKYCSNRISTNVKPSLKFGRIIKVDKRGIEYEVIETVWSIEGKNRVVYFRAD